MARVSCYWCGKDTHGIVSRYNDHTFCKGFDCMELYMQSSDRQLRPRLLLQTAESDPTQGRLFGWALSDNVGHYGE